MESFPKDAADDRQIEGRHNMYIEGGAVSHWGNKSFPSGKIKFPRWETFVSIVGN
ncbi:hypothetical protein JCM6292_984 [Bacteroides pyogenes JCM 6292]|uniref:Uncharacterized protein n=1 Tax=Bacteroides pyogenes JCM 6292 TaxID=1235809 RepID=W4P4U7_9BACE|nr:hypothetical protein JCM6292_984 [Bacteroides pyogenes JCM 6292]